jgi:hypothetical protein
MVNSLRPIQRTSSGRRKVNGVLIPLTTKAEEISTTRARPNGITNDQVDSKAHHAPQSNLIRHSSSRPQSSSKRKFEEIGEDIAAPIKVSVRTVTSPKKILRAINGIQTTLDTRQGQLRLLPSIPHAGQPESKAEGRKPDDKDEKRSLRSQDGGFRLRSDLSIYFPNYDSIINNIRGSDGQ